MGKRALLTLFVAYTSLASNVQDPSFVYGDGVSTFTAHSTCPDTPMFRHSSGATECLFDPDSGTTELVLFSNGLPDHWFDPDFAGASPQEWEPAFPLRPSPDFAMASLDRFSSGGASPVLSAGALVGFAVNGVPFFKALHPSVVTSSSSSAATGAAASAVAADGCLGSVDPSSGAYHYTTAPPCLVSAQRSPASDGARGFGGRRAAPHGSLLHNGHGHEHEALDRGKVKCVCEGGLFGW